MNGGEITDPKPARKWMTMRWTRISTLLALILLVPMLVAWYLQPWYFARRMFHETSGLDSTPAKLRDEARSSLSPTRFETFEYSFQTPWGPIDQRKDPKGGVVLVWTDGRTVVAFPPALKSAISDNQMPRKPGGEVFEAALPNPGYNGTAAAMNTTPEQLHWWNRSGTMRAALLLVMKQADMAPGKIIYKIENDELRGFQFNDREVDPQVVTLVLFDVNGRRYRLMIGVPATAQEKITQADINAIVASIRPVPHG